MKKTLLALCVMALAAVMSSCGGNSGNASGDSSADTTSCCQPNGDKAGGDGAQCTEKKAEDCCSGAGAKSEAAPAVDLTKKYVCPNRDGSSDNPGTCEACGMDLIEN